MFVGTVFFLRPPFVVDLFDVTCHFLGLRYIKFFFSSRPFSLFFLFFTCPILPISSSMAASISADFAALFHTVCSSSFAVLSPVLSKTSAFQVMQQGIASPEMVLGEDFFDLDLDEASDRLSQVVSGLDSIAFSDVSTLYAFVTAIQRAIFSRSDVQVRIDLLANENFSYFDFCHISIRFFLFLLFQYSNIGEDSFSTCLEHVEWLFEQTSCSK